MMNEELHIHFDHLIEPFANRLTKVEVSVEHMDNDLKKLSNQVHDLRLMLEQHSKEETAILREISANIASNREEVRAIRSWLVGIGVGAGALITLIGVLFKFGLLHGAG